MMIGVIISPATGSAHHQPHSALSDSPPSRMPDSAAQRLDWRESACNARLLRTAANRRLRADSSGITISDSTARTIPIRLTSGGVLAMSDRVASTAT